MTTQVDCNIWTDEHEGPLTGLLTAARVARVEDMAAVLQMVVDTGELTATVKQRVGDVVGSVTEDEVHLAERFAAALRRVKALQDDWAGMWPIGVRQ